MTLKENINAIFQKYNTKLSATELEEEAPATEEVVLAEAELADGTKIYSDAEAWEAGVNVFILNDEEEKIPVPTGEYELSDGRVVVVTDGLLDSITEAEAEVVEEEMKKEVEKVVAEADIPLTKEDVLGIIEKAVGALRSEFTSHIEAKDKEIEKIKAEFSHKGLPRVAERKPELKREEIAKLNTTERVAALFNKFN